MISLISLRSIITECYLQMIKTVIFFVFKNLNMAKRNLYSIGPSGPLNSLKCYSTELNLTTDYKRLDESTWKLSVIKENLIELATITLRINDDKTIGTSALYRVIILLSFLYMISNNYLE